MALDPAGLKRLVFGHLDPPKIECGEMLVRAGRLSGVRIGLERGWPRLKELLRARLWATRHGFPDRPPSRSSWRAESGLKAIHCSLSTETSVTPLTKRPYRPPSHLKSASWGVAGSKCSRS